MTTADVYAERDRATFSIVLNRPDKLNAFTESMAADMARLIEEARVDEDIRCVLVRGNGRAFCAGDDLGRTIPTELGPPDIQTKLRTSYVRVILDLLNLRKPVVGMLQGYALGAGLDLALACDFRIASDDLQMGSPVVQWGLGGAGVYLLTQYLGFGRATELMMTGDRIDSEQAARWGLLTDVVTPDALHARTAELVARLEDAATSSIGLIKTARNRCIASDPVHGLEAQVLANLELPLLADPEEGRRAWRERRTPSFTGRYRNMSGR